MLGYLQILFKLKIPLEILLGQGHPQHAGTQLGHSLEDQAQRSRVIPLKLPSLLVLLLLMLQHDLDFQPGVVLPHAELFYYSFAPQSPPAQFNAPFVQKLEPT